MACGHIPGCPLFPKLTASLAVWKKLYCESDGRFTTCARFCKSKAGEPVPGNLLPNGKMVEG
jgi:hypothetical protein